MRVVMEASGLTFWPALSLAVFFAACLGMLAWVFRPGSRAFYRDLGRLALQDSPTPNPNFEKNRGDMHATQG